MKYYVQVKKENQNFCIYFPQAPGCQTFTDKESKIKSTAKEALTGWLFSGGQPSKFVADSYIKLSDYDFVLKIKKNMTIQEFKVQIPTSELQKTLQQEKYSFLEKILFAIGLPLADHFPDGLVDMMVENKIKLRKFLFTFGSNISFKEIDAGGIQIYCESELVAELFNPEKVLFLDPLTKLPHFYLNYRYSSLFEQG